MVCAAYVEEKIFLKNAMKPDASKEVESKL